VRIFKKGHMTNWKDFFNKYLIQSQFYRLDKSEKVGDTDVEYYISIKENNSTKLQIGYLSHGELIYIEILHPDTFGHNKLQKQEYFDHNDFSLGQSGTPGLIFNDINSNGIKNLLKKGFRGKEIQYYQDDKLIKSKVFRTSSQSDNFDSVTTIWFEKENILKRIKKVLSGKSAVFEIREIKLDKIFPGLNLIE
jgi:hypothetical protein